MSMPVDEFVRQRHAKEDEARAELAELVEATQPPAVDQPSDVDGAEFEREILEAVGDVETGMLFAEARESRAAFWQGNAIIGPKIGARIAELLEDADRFPEESAERGDRVRQAGALAFWLKREAEQQMPPRQRISRKGFQHPDGSFRVVDVFADGRRVEISRRTPAELAELEAERDQQDEARKSFGAADKHGTWTVTVADAQAMSVDQWMSLDPDVREGLLRGRDQTGVKLKSESEGRTS